MPYPIRFHLPASSDACVPGVMWTSIWEYTGKKETLKIGCILKNVMKGTDIHTLNLFGRQRSSLTLIDRPMSVAMLQWGMVGVNSTSTVLSPSFTCKTQSSLVWLFGVSHFYKYKSKSSQRNRPWGKGGGSCLLLLALAPRHWVPPEKEDVPGRWWFGSDVTPVKEEFRHKRYVKY